MHSLGALARQPRAVSHAAETGEAQAMLQMALLCAAGLDRDKDWPLAIEWLCRAALAGDGEAQETLVVLCRQPGLLAELAAAASRGAQPDPGIWRRLALSIDLDLLLRAPVELAQVVADPRVAVTAGLADPGLCRWLIYRAAPHLARAVSWQDGALEGLPDPRRTNTSAHFDFHNAGLPLLALRERIAHLFQRPTSHLEPTNVLCYAPGQTYKLHLDAWEPGDVALRGQRTDTLLIYLNEDYEAGETHFPMLGFSYRGRTGHSLTWANLDAQGLRDPRTAHAGRPPTHGTKWVLSQWIADRPYADPPAEAFTASEYAA